MKKNKKIITICSSAAFFKQNIEVAEKLKVAGFKVKIPLSAERMKRAGDFNVERSKPWLKEPKEYKSKTFFMNHHIDKVLASDAILVLNYNKKGIDGYIGGNTLIEIAIAFVNKKPIYILNSITDDLGFKEEIMGMKPIFINGDLNKIQKD